MRARHNDRIAVIAAAIAAAVMLLGGFLVGCQKTAPKPPDSISAKRVVEKFEAKKTRQQWRIILGPRKSKGKEIPGDPEQGFEILASPEMQEYIHAASAASELPADVLHAVARLESAGDTDVVSSAQCVGVAQFAAGTARDHGLKVDRARYMQLRNEKRKFETELARTPHTDWQLRSALRRAIEAHEKAMRMADERCDPEKAFVAMGRYLARLRNQFGGRLDWAIAAYHMGQGNLTKVLELYTLGNRRVLRYNAQGKLVSGNAPWNTAQTIRQNELEWSRVLMEVTPQAHPATYKKLQSLNDRSDTYYWRVMACHQLLRLYREDRVAFHRELRSHNPKAYAARHKSLNPKEAALAEKWEARTEKIADQVIEPAMEHPILLAGWIIMLLNALATLAAWLFLPWYSPALREKPWRRVILAFGWIPLLTLIVYVRWPGRNPDTQS